MFSVCRTLLIFAWYRVMNLMFTLSNRWLTASVARVWRTRSGTSPDVVAFISGRFCKHRQTPQQSDRSRSRQPSLRAQPSPAQPSPAQPSPAQPAGRCCWPLLQAAPFLYWRLRVALSAQYVCVCQASLSAEATVHARCSPPLALSAYHGRRPLGRLPPLLLDCHCRRPLGLQARPDAPAARWVPD